MKRLYLTCLWAKTHASEGRDAFYGFLGASSNEAPSSPQDSAMVRSHRRRLDLKAAVRSARHNGEKVRALRIAEPPPTDDR